MTVLSYATIQQNCGELHSHVFRLLKEYNLVLDAILQKPKYIAVFEHVSG